MYKKSGKILLVSMVAILLVVSLLAACDDDGTSETVSTVVPTVEPTAGTPEEPTPTVEPTATIESTPTPIDLPPPDLNTGPFYADTAWPSIHGNSGNSDYSPFFASTDLTEKWGALEGATMFLSPTFGPEGNIYATAGRGEGFSHLHCFDRDGNLLWKAPPQQSLDDLDYAASINAPVVDIDGDIYVGDMNQLWAFHPDGNIKWVTNIAQLGAAGHFVTPFFSKEGHVGGISTDGKVLFFERGTGILVWPVLDLPGVAGPIEEAAPPGIMGGGLLEPSFIQPMWNLIWGKEIEVANTPAVHPVTGRIYISAGGPTPENGALYGIDTGPNGPTIAFETPMGAGSGTSPALSPGGLLVYVADDGGVMYAVDTESGDVVWEMTETMAAASPTVGPDGTVYSYSVSTMVALDGTDGSIKWKMDYEYLGEEYLPEPSKGDRTARINCVPTMSSGVLWAAIDMDYGVLMGDQIAPLPQKTFLVAIDPADGSIISLTQLRDTCSALTEPNSDGIVYVSLAGIANSVYYYGLNTMFPEDIQVKEQPVAGLVALQPTSFAAHSRGGIEWAQKLTDQAAANASEGNASAAIFALETARAQLRGIQISIQDAGDNGELKVSSIDTIQDELNQAEAHIYNAVILLQQEDLVIDDEVAAAHDLLEGIDVSLSPLTN